MKKVVFIYSLIILCCGMLGAYVYMYLTTYNNITHSFVLSESKYDFLESSNSLTDNLKDAESSQRGYLITNDLKYLEPYNNAIYQLNFENERFAKIVKTYELNDDYENQLKNIQELIMSKTKEMDSTISLQKEGKYQEAVNLVKSDLGKNLMTEILNVAQQMNTSQKYRETQAKQAIYKYRANLRYFNLAVIAFTFLSLIMIGFYIRSCAVSKGMAS